MQAAVAEFDAVYLNPSAATSPERRQKALERLRAAHAGGDAAALTDAQQRRAEITAELRRIAAKPNPLPASNPAERDRYDALLASYNTRADEFEARCEQILNPPAPQRVAPRGAPPVAQHGRPDLPEPDPKRRKLDNGAPMAGDQPQARPVLPAAPAVTLPADQDTEMPLETEPEPVSALQPVIDMFGD